jgi:deoxyribonuclease V
MDEVSQQDVCPLVIVDVDYREAEAVAAAIVASSWTANAPIEQRTIRIAAVKPYQPGAFYQRELPCILDVLSLVQSPYRAIVIDGYVDLDDRGTPGLGGHLHSHLRAAVPIVGVAKTAYRGSSFARPVLRGTSARPLFVTARGIELDRAALFVAQMHGSHRIPTLLKHVDGLARSQ